MKHRSNIASREAIVTAEVVKIQLILPSRPVKLCPRRKCEPGAVFVFVTENILSHTCVVLKMYDAIYSVVYVLESNAF